MEKQTENTEKLSETHVFFLIGVAIYFISYLMFGINMFFWAILSHTGAVLALYMSKKQAMLVNNAHAKAIMDMFESVEETEEAVNESDNVVRMPENNVEFEFEDGWDDPA